MPSIVTKGLASALLLSLIAPATPGFASQPPGAILRSKAGAHHLYCTGTGAPTVLLEAGIGGTYLDWTFVQPQLSRTMQVCSYDRAGMGWSEAETRPRTLDNITDELRATVALAALAPPFIVVGHSFGGLVALHYARLHPEEVAGLVLVDSTHPDQFPRLREIGVTLPDPYRAVARTPPSAAAQGLPDGLQRVAITLAGAAKAREALLGETVALEENASVVDREGVPHVPARVLVHGNDEWNRIYPDGRMEAAWRAMQQQLAVDLGAPPPIIAAGSGHQIPLEAPDLVVRAVQDLVASLPPGASPSPGMR